MTTIAYNHKDKEIAFDSRISRGETVISDTFRKDITNSDGVVFVLAGITSDCYLVAECYPTAPNKDVRAYGFVIDSGVVKWITFDDNGINITEVEYNEAAGSGQDHALTAMDLGCSAKDAVKMAIKRDVYSGGRIRVIKV